MTWPTITYRRPLDTSAGFSSLTAPVKRQEGWRGNSVSILEQPNTGTAMYDAAEPATEGR